MTTPKRMIVAISGASGAAIGARIVERLAQLGGIEIHLVVSAAAERTLATEVGPDALPRLRKLATHHHAHDDIGACIASGSFQASGMIVAPCSVHTLSAIAWGHLDNLLVRAADVQLKERRRLILMVREAPLHLGHLRAMAQAAEIGAIIFPPVPAFYLKPQTVAQLVNDIAERAITLMALEGIAVPLREWRGESNE
ncbi:MAG: UbiX family flavin prenyltransferase [Variibacter sp.]